MWGRKYINITELAALVSLLVGSSFVVFVIITTGYFQVVGPKMLGWFLEANLIQGAALSIPYIVIAATALVPIIFIRSQFSLYIRRYLDLKHPGLNPHTIRVIRLLGALAGMLSCYAVSAYLIYTNNEKFYTYFTVILLVFGLIFTEFVYGIRNVMNSMFVYCSVPLILIIIYYFLYFSGMAMAVESLNNSEERYNVYSDDKSYINALIIRSTSNTIIIKVGQEILFLDRKNIKRLERIYNKDKNRGIRGARNF